ncbi:TonB-linked SusC/RagA family outer membrane protein [Mucilaginibacter frigoritolerans]|uniref:TonB-linked SusC/RagA family outer membrane protein n=1 Tax=Mucilaginibacter frigoritolerans TaxID=652788 RepID=A0A562TYI1_9SPHI|nr:SusC/RagA family TonB-linked outer membrane protein [Mucilaginibacter frigoritolerans]TWI98652.1 TonB-linked SusC/RagA family outer membrane protein [Mucilaginibacter frigoritolerans]
MKKILLIILLFPSISAMAGSRHYGNMETGKDKPGSSSFVINFNDNLALIKGIVKDATGQPLVGVTVGLKGTTQGTQTDVNGEFSISANPGDVLVFTYIGYLKKEVTVVTTGKLVVEMASDAKNLNEVVVTALGVKRSEKSLTYATQQISGSELTNVRTDNLVNSLSGKIAGVTIDPSASGIGGSSKVILRGNRSLDGNNQPLYVIDGVPISNNGNPTGQPNDAYGGNPEGGDGIGNLNPDDIESMTVLKGGPAAALYGSGAANGVILITTKKGKAGKMTINFSSAASMDKAAYFPQFQNSYGQTSPGATTSFGAPISGAPDNLKQFFQTGNNFTNSLSLSGGSEIAQTYISYTNTEARGIEPGNKLTRNNFNLHETAKFLNDKLTVDGNVSYITQTLDNSPALGYYSNPLTGLYLFPRGQNIAPYKNYEGPDGSNGAPTQNWPFQEDIQQNPWWIVNRNPNEASRNRILMNGSVKYDINNWLNVQARGSLDRSVDAGDQKYYAGTLAPLAAPNGNGSWNGFNQTMQQKYADVIVSVNVPNPNKSPFKVDGLVGASITDNTTNNLTFGPYPQSPYLFGLFVPNLFTIQNIEVAPAGANNPYGSNVSGGIISEYQTQSIFGSGNVSFKNWAYLTLTERVDWSSTLAFTSAFHYSYPSAGLSFILNQMFTLPQEITYAKIRGSYASVGNSPGQYLTNPVNYPSGNSVTFNSAAPYPTLKPERTKTQEYGTDLRFFQDKLSFSFTYYKTNTIDQTIQVTPPAASGYGSGYVNAGNIENKGVEITVGYNMIQNKNFSWNSTVNFSRNINKVIDIDSKDGIDSVQLTNSSSYRSYVRNGGSFGDIYGQTLVKNAQGQVELTAAGIPLASANFVKIANPEPKFQLGWNNSFTYNHFSFNFLVDGKFGGQVVSVMQSLLDDYGVSKAYGDARTAGGVKVNGVGPGGESITTVDAQTWYTSVGGRNAILGQYVYSATTIRLREADLGYTLPLKNSAFKSFRLSVTGRNLIYFYKKAPFDPELTSSTGNGLGGVDIFNQPALRSYGLKLDVTL